MPPPPQFQPSSYSWGGLIDLMRRQGAASLNISGSDQLQIAQAVSAYAYTKYLWPFTLATTPLGSIPCVNKVQDYSSPTDLRVLSRAWLYVPTVIYDGGTGDNTVPPYDDPSALALQAAILSAAYVGSTTGGGTPAATIWPQSGSLDVVKRLPPNLYLYAYTQIQAITQQPNNGLLRLSGATSVSSNQPYSLELEYQILRPKVNALTELCWFPDDYVSIAWEGILYFLYKFNNDLRAGTVAFQVGRPPAYSGQYAVWMAAMESAAAADREGSVDNITPSDSLGNQWDNWGGFIG